MIEQRRFDIQTDAFHQEIPFEPFSIVKSNNCSMKTLEILEIL
jgi:hypothetical protein